MSTSRSAGPRALLTPAGLHILLSLASEDRHGYGIKTEIEARTDGALNLGPATLYEAIHRMVKAGWIAETPRSRAADDRRRVYSLTTAGRREMTDELERLDEIVRHARNNALLATPRRSR